MKEEPEFECRIEVKHLHFLLRGIFFHILNAVSGSAHIIKAEESPCRIETALAPLPASPVNKGLEILVLPFRSLKDGEIDAMLASPQYAFTGTPEEKLEKIYLQEMIHFTLYPNEVYVTARRSGYPSFSSTILPRPSYADVPASSIPRRFPTGGITDDDLSADVRRAAYQEQSLSVTSSGIYDKVLATERLWADLNAPEWGAGR